MSALMGTLWGMSISIAALLFYLDNYYDGYVSSAHIKTLKTLLCMTALPLGILHYALDLPMLIGFLRYAAVFVI